MRKISFVVMCAIFSLELLACEKEPEALVENIDYLPEAEIVKDEPDIQEENNLELDIEDDVAIQYSPVSGEDYTLTETAVDESHYIIELFDDSEVSVQQIEIETLDVSPIRCAAFEIQDINGDGYMDVPAVVGMGNVNSMYEIYLWNKDKKCLEKNDFLKDEGCILNGIEADGGIITFSRSSAASSCSRFYVWDNPTTSRLIKTYSIDYDEDMNAHYFIEDEQGVIVDEILSEADADKNWSIYNDFFEMRVENTESTLNGTQYTGYVFDDNQPGKKVPVEFEVDGEKHLIIK